MRKRYIVGAILVGAGVALYINREKVKEKVQKARVNADELHASVKYLHNLKQATDAPGEFKIKVDTPDDINDLLNNLMQDISRGVMKNTNAAHKAD